MSLIRRRGLLCKLCDLHTMFHKVFSDLNMCTMNTHHICVGTCRMHMQDVHAHMLIHVHIYKVYNNKILKYLL